MHSASFILADAETDVIVGVIVVTFWALSAIAKILKNVNAPSPRRMATRPPSLPPILPPAPRRPAQAPRQSFPAQRKMPPMPARAAPTQVIMAGQEKVYVLGKTPAPALPPPANVLKPPAPSQIRAANPPIAPATAHHPNAASAATIGKWLTPKTLKKQYILTELLQPPLALRDSASPR